MAGRTIPRPQASARPGFVNDQAQDTGREDPAIAQPPPPSPVRTRKRPAASPTTPRKQAALRRPRARAQKPEPTPDALAATLSLITESLADDKAENIVVLDLSGKSSFADRMVIATGLAERQLQAMATHVMEKFAAAGRRKPAVEGMGASDWVLIDAGDVVVHLFRPEARAAYALEAMWGPDFPEPSDGSG
jgi:ribosome-associated protein